MTFKKELNIDSLTLNPKCSVCGESSAHIEIVAPGGYPSGANSWDREAIESYKKYRNFALSYLLYSGPGGSNGLIGDPVESERVAVLKSAFIAPYDAKEIKSEFYDMAGFCAQCNMFYCPSHWKISSTGYGHCPQGHGMSLDPHWSPE